MSRLGKVKETFFQAQGRVREFCIKSTKFSRKVSERQGILFQASHSVREDFPCCQSYFKKKKHIYKGIEVLLLPLLPKDLYRVVGKVGL